MLDQQSARLKRSVTIGPIDPGAPKPLARDERIGFHARILALEEELRELQARGLTLTEAHHEMSRQLRTEMAKCAEVVSQLETYKTRYAELSQDLGQSETERGKLNNELQRLQARLSAYELDKTFEPAHSPG